MNERRVDPGDRNAATTLCSHLESLIDSQLSASDRLTSEEMISHYSQALDISMQQYERLEAITAGTHDQIERLMALVERLEGTVEYWQGVALGFIEPGLIDD